MRLALLGNGEQLAYPGRRHRIGEKQGVGLDREENERLNADSHSESRVHAPLGLAAVNVTDSTSDLL